MHSLRESHCSMCVHSRHIKWSGAPLHCAALFGSPVLGSALCPDLQGDSRALNPCFTPQQPPAQIKVSIILPLEPYTHAALQVRLHGSHPTGPSLGASSAGDVQVPVPHPPPRAHPGFTLQGPPTQDPPCRAHPGSALQGPPRIRPSGPTQDQPCRAHPGSALQGPPRICPAGPTHPGSTLQGPPTQDPPCRAHPGSTLQGPPMICPAGPTQDPPCMAHCCVRVGSRWFPPTQPPPCAALRYGAALARPDCCSGVKLKRTLQTFITQSCLKLLLSTDAGCHGHGFK